MAPLESAVQLELTWTTCYSPILPPDDTGTVAVIDGSKPENYVCWKPT